MKKKTNPTPMEHEGTRLTVASGSATLSHDELMDCQVLHDLGRVVARGKLGQDYSYITVRDVLTLLGRINQAKRKTKSPGGRGFQNPEVARRAQLKSAEARRRNKLEKTD